MISLRIVSMLLTLGIYIVGGYYSALISVVFSLVRDYCNLRLKGRKTQLFVLGSVVALGTFSIVLSAAKQGNTWQDFLPAASFLTYSAGQILAKTARQMRVVNAADVVLFWLIYDYTNMLIICVVQDLYLLLLPLAARYVERDRELLPTEEKARS